MYVILRPTQDDVKISMLIKLSIPNLTKENAHRFESEALAITGVQKVDTWSGRAELEVMDEFVKRSVIEILTRAGFPPVVPSTITTKVCLDGMTCRACEITVEQQWKNIPGVHKVDVNSHTGIAQIVHDKNEMVHVSDLQKALSDKKYIVRSFEEKRTAFQAEQPSFIRILGLFALVFFLGALLRKLGIFSFGTAVTQSMSFAAAVVLGLVAGTSSCLAVSGGLLLSCAAKFNERYRTGSANDRFRPVFLFVLGRVIGYGFLGGLVGLLGSAFTFSPILTGGLIILAAFFMILMGFDMLNISPKWLKACMPRMPKAISRRVMDADGKDRWFMPFLLGGGTFFLPCGFTQALQVYALTTGSFWQSALMLAGFAVGTSPALLALGWASSSLKGKAGKFFFQFSGALVIVLGIWNIQNGFALAGFRAPDFRSVTVDTTAQVVQNAMDDPNVNVVDGVQQIEMSLTGTKPYYRPSNEYTVKAGVPVRLQINGGGSGCRAFFQIPKLGISEELSGEKTVMDFTPKKPGSYTFTCSMGMYRGTLNVVSST